MNWIKVEDLKEGQLPTQTPLLCYVPEWCPECYVVAEWSNKESKFEFSGDNGHEDFSDYVRMVSLFDCAD